MPSAYQRLILQIEVFAAVFCFALASGCGDADDGRQALRGKVTVDGQALSEGVIRFRPQAGTLGPSAGGAIRNGEFSIPPKKGTFAGKFDVVITAVKKTGKKLPAAMGSGMVDEYVQYLPERYNAKSELTAEVRESTAEQHVFDLKSR